MPLAYPLAAPLGDGIDANLGPSPRFSMAGSRLIGEDPIFALLGIPVTASGVIGVPLSSQGVLSNLGLARVARFSMADSLGG